MKAMSILLAALAVGSFATFALPAASATDCTQITNACVVRCIVNHEGNCVPEPLTVETHHCPPNEFLPGYEVTVLGVTVLNTYCTKIAP